MFVYLLLLKLDWVYVLFYFNMSVYVYNFMFVGEDNGWKAAEQACWRNEYFMLE